MTLPPVARRQEGLQQPGAPDVLLPEPGQRGPGQRWPRLGGQQPVHPERRRAGGGGDPLRPRRHGGAKGSPIDTLAKQLLVMIGNLV